MQFIFPLAALLVSPEARLGPEPVLVPPQLQPPELRQLGAGPVGAAVLRRQNLRPRLRQQRGGGRVLHLQDRLVLLVHQRYRDLHQLLDNCRHVQEEDAGQGDEGVVVHGVRLLEHDEELLDEVGVDEAGVGGGHVGQVHDHLHPLGLGLRQHACSEDTQEEG